ncbi:hypothetical protein KUTeg_016513 [Tegillarca granosa]|uniref:Armadillo repeat-containing protein 7 n=1 Tax=Tegillarca granosa TaxID=220873 RepID=A0ABQ9ERR7_TEGGR|nr:hypothetical protein KUTeg_016513 [Tegillarca granosa]
MFSTKEQLEKKTGPYGIGRLSYLQSLVTEFQDTSSQDAVEETDEKLVEFAIGGICNLCLDKENKEYILKNGGVTLAIKCLSSSNEETVLSAITTLMYLMTPASKSEISCTPVIECMIRFSKSSNKRLSNLAHVFLQDYCTKTQVEEAEKIHQQLINAT